MLNGTSNDSGAQRIHEDWSKGLFGHWPLAMLPISYRGLIMQWFNLFKWGPLFRCAIILVCSPWKWHLDFKKELKRHFCPCQWRSHYAWLNNNRYGLPIIVIFCLEDFLIQYYFNWRYLLIDYASCVVFCWHFAKLCSIIFGGVRIVIKKCVSDDVARWMNVVLNYYF